MKYKSKSLESRLPFYHGIKNEIKGYSIGVVKDLNDKYQDYFLRKPKEVIHTEFKFTDSQYLDFKTEIWPALLNVLFKIKKTNPEIDINHVETLIMYDLLDKHANQYKYLFENNIKSK